MEFPKWPNDEMLQTWNLRPIKEDCQGHTLAVVNVEPHSPEARFIAFPLEHHWLSTEIWEVWAILFSVQQTATVIDCHLLFLKLSYGSSFHFFL